MRGYDVTRSVVSLAFGTRPLRDALVIAGQQYLRDAVASKAGGTCVAGGAETALEERVTARAVQIRHRAREQSHGRVDDRQRRRFAATQHEVAERDLFS